jgi:cytochrome b pre-mRNA-processing protein 3
MMSRPFRWPFAPRKSRPPVRGATIEAIYGMIVAQARLPQFYLRFGVPDTVNGRFDMVVLHLWMVLARLRAVGAVAEAQQLFDRFCNDMDANLREMGVGDLTVPKRMKKFGEAFYGRSGAYDAAIIAGEGEMRAALARNVLATDDAAAAAPLASYVSRTVAALAPIDAAALLSGAWRFPNPE